jgi:hypothetical protein
LSYDAQGHFLALAADDDGDGVFEPIRQAPGQGTPARPPQ